MFSYVPYLVSSQTYLEIWNLEFIYSLSIITVINVTM
jgi:hypothetical protein